MKLLDKLTDSPIQRYTVVTETGDQIALELRYLPTQQSWMASVSWNNFYLNGINLTVSPNILYGFENILPFGFAVTSNDSLDPTYIDDFTTGRIKVYVLTADDIAIKEGILLNE